MSDTSKLKDCPKCGAPIPAEAPQGLCPKCLLAQASIPTESGNDPSTRPIPPSPKEIAAAFPNLEILDFIGQGGMGFVFKARQPKLDRFVALKILPQSLAKDSAFADRFAREGRLLARLNHPNIVSVHDFGQANGFFYLLMEFVDGVNLRQAMRAGRFTPEQALAVVPKICDALQFAHNEGVLHRDIKPENILLDSKGRLKIADFGIAKLVGEPRADPKLTASGGTLGTPHYMAPEQIEKPSAVDHRADIYSLGVVFYEMLTGELPIGKFQPPSQKVHIDVRLDDVVLHALEKEPARRYQQASEIKTAVDTINSTAPALVRESEILRVGASPVQPPDRFWRRFAVAVALFIAALIIIPGAIGLVAIIVPYMMKQRAEPAQVDQAEVQAAAARAMRITAPALFARIPGTVTDAETGRPIPGSHVTDERAGRIGKLILQETNTDSAGHFELIIARTFPHHLIVDAVGYETNHSNLAPVFFTNKNEQPVHIQLKPGPKALGAMDVTETGGLLVIENERFEPSSPEPNQLDWGFKVFVPPDSLATVLFVSWSNGVPTVDPGFSRYFKVGKAGGVDIPYCLLSCYREGESRYFSPLNESDRAQYLAGWHYFESASNAVHWNVNLDAGSTAGALRVMPPYHRVKTTLPLSVSSGHQLCFPLIEFERPSNGPSYGWSGVDLRIFLEPLQFPAIRMRPNEKDMTNYIAAEGLLGTADETLRMIREEPLYASADDPATVRYRRAQQLQQALSELNAVLLKYTETHPTVIALRQRIAELRKGL